MKFFMPLLGTFLGAGLAFISNILHDKRRQKIEEGNELKILWVNCLSLLNQLVFLKASDIVERKNEYKEFCKLNDGGNYKKLFLSVVTSKLSIHSSITKLGFMSCFKPDGQDFYFLILTLDKTIKDFDIDLNNLNTQLSKLNLPAINTLDVTFLCSYTENYIKTTDTCIAYLYLCLLILARWIPQYDLKFSVKFELKKYMELIPSSDFLIEKGFDTLAKKYEYF